MKSLNAFSFTILPLVFLSCQQNTKVPVPVDDWKLFDSPSAQPLNVSMRNKLEGVYAIEENENFGDLAAIKWSYTVRDADTLYQLSIFCEKDIGYFVCEGKKLNDKILLDGFWRKMENDETGKARFIANEKNGSVVEGIFGDDEQTPNKKIRFRYQRPLFNKTPLEIVAHRGGGRMTDFIPSSENSIALILKAARFGATGVEIDVQLTKDGVPVLFHDANINNRLTKEPLVYPPVSHYTYAELIKKYQLKKGEEIPKLSDALDSIVHRTPLQFVWLDTKDKNVLPQLRALQKEFMQAASSLGKKIEILIGVHSDEILERFKALGDYRDIPSICELDPEVAIAINAKVWAGLWLKRVNDDDVTFIRDHDKKAFVWTVDKASQISEMVLGNKFDGIVSNHPSCVAFYYYTKQ